MTFMKSPAMILHELCIKVTKTPPIYTPISIIEGEHQNKFICRVEALGVDTTARGVSKKEAKQQAARKVLNILKNKDQISPATKKIIATVAPKEGHYKLKNVNYRGENKCKLDDSIKTSATADIQEVDGQTVAPPTPKDIQTKHDDEKVTKLYEGVTKLGKNLQLSVTSYNRSLKILMETKGISAKDLETFFNPPYNEEKLKSLLNKLDLTYKIVNITGETDEVNTVIAEVKIGWSLTTIGQSSTAAAAIEDAINNLFVIVKDLTTYVVNL